MELGERVSSDERPICQDCSKASHAAYFLPGQGERRRARVDLQGFQEFMGVGGGGMEPLVL